VVGNLATLGSDVASLAELQAKLIALDLKESAARAAVPLAFVLVGATLGLAAIPVLLLGAGELLVSLAHMQRAWAYLAVGALALAMGLILALVLLPKVTASFSTLTRSREELARNLAWIKTVLAYSGRMPSQRN
jgi:hypothetical protein